MRDEDVHNLAKRPSLSEELGREILIISNNSVLKRKRDNLPICGSVTVRFIQNIPPIHFQMQPEVEIKNLSRNFWQNKSHLSYLISYSKIFSESI